MSRPMCLAASTPTVNTPRPVASRRPSEPPRSTGLPVTTPVAVEPSVHRVRVHHPGHDLLVGVHVGRRDVLVRADDDADLAGVAARHALELAARELLRVDPDAALGAAVGHVHRRVLDRHPGRQRHHFRQASRPGENARRPCRARARRCAARGSLRSAPRVPSSMWIGTSTISTRFGRLSVSAQRARLPRWGIDAVDLLQVVAPGAEVVRLEVRGKRVVRLAAMRRWAATAVLTFEKLLVDFLREVNAQSLAASARLVQGIVINIYANNAYDESAQATSGSQLPHQAECKPALAERADCIEQPVSLELQRRQPRVDAAARHQRGVRALLRRCGRGPAPRCGRPAAPSPAGAR